MKKYLSYLLIVLVLVLGIFAAKTGYEYYTFGKYFSESYRENNSISEGDLKTSFISSENMDLICKSIQKQKYEIASNIISTPIPKDCGVGCGNSVERKIVACGDYFFTEQWSVAGGVATGPFKLDKNLTKKKDEYICTLSPGCGGI